MTISTLATATVARASTAVETVEKAADSRYGKWASMAAIVASLTTGVVNYKTAKWHHEETMAHFEKQEKVNHYQLGSNLTAAVESGIVKP